MKRRTHSTINLNNFHSLSVGDAIKSLNSDKSGLSDKEASQRLLKYGKNELPEKRKSFFIFNFVKHFNSLVIYLLIVAIGISYFFGNMIDVYVISIVILINTSISFIQEYRTEKSLKALKKLIVYKTRVLRDNGLIYINSIDLVPGDIILLEEGDRIPADARLIELKNLRTIESSLTGESFPVEKSLSILDKKAPLADRKNSIFLGTFVAGGTAKAIVVSTGEKTALGQIALSIKEIKQEKSHFRIKTDSLAFKMVVFAVIGASLTFLIGYFIRGFEFNEIFLFTIASLVSGIPEGLPAVMAIVLAIGAFRMSKRNALIRNLASTESIGVVSTIITDKTGTLTQNTMNIQEIFLPGQSKISVSGDGWKPEGEFKQKNKSIIPLENSHLKKLIHISAICNRTSVLFNPESKEYQIVGDPTEAAFIVLAEKAGLKKSLALKDSPLLEDFPFNSNLKLRASLISNDEKEVYTFGAPETILNRCSYVLINGRKTKLLDKQAKEIHSQLNLMSGQAMRVIALAYKPSPKLSTIKESNVSDLVFVGLVGMSDPPRPEIKDALIKARTAGIRVIMATGDHKETALAIAKQIGLISPSSKEKAITGEELSKLSQSDFDNVIAKTEIFARLDPKTKLRIVESIQKNGEIVAMTGDGVNDAPALKKADIGIAMGIMGTDVARESAEFILTDDNFASIINAVEEGRIVFNNLRRTSFFLVTTNVAENLTIISTLLVGLPLPLLATQILWLNLVTDTGSGIGLASEPSHEHSTLNLPPRNQDEQILTKEIIPFLLIMAGLMAILTYFSFSFFLPSGLDKARTAAFSIMAFTQLFNSLNMRALRKSIFKIGIATNKYLNIAILTSLILIILVINVPFLQTLLGFSSLKWLEIIVLIAISSLILIVGEIYKKIFFGKPL